VIREIVFSGLSFKYDTETKKVLDCPGFDKTTDHPLQDLAFFTQVHLRSPHQRRVDKFMRLAHQSVPLKPQILTPEQRVLRARLIMEEALETVEALGVKIEFSASIQHSDVTLELGFDDLKFRAEGVMDLVGTVDGCFDLRVVTTGTLSAVGVPDSGQRIVDDNNLDKFGPGHSIDSFGKLVKPPGHRPPNEAIAQWLAKLSE
jgi:predicted HAD superfamily Cof-like phosphohydrolase